MLDLLALEEAYRKHTQTALPDAPMEDEVYEIYAELVLLDAHISGLVSSYLKGKKIDFDLLNAGRAFETMVIKAEPQFESLRQMVERKEQLDQLVNMIKAIERID